MNSVSRRNFSFETFRHEGYDVEADAESFADAVDVQANEDNETEARQQIDEMRRQAEPIETLLIVAKTSNIETFIEQAGPEIQEDLWKWYILTKVRHSLLMAILKKNSGF